MKLGFKSPMITSRYGWKPGAVKDFDRVGAVRELAWMREKGFDAVEFSDGSSGGSRGFYDFTLDDWPIYRATLEEAGLEIACVHALRKMLSRPLWAKEKEADLEHLIKVTEIVGAKILSVMMAPPAPARGYTGPSPRYVSHRDFTMTDYEFCAKKLKGIARRLADIGAKLCLEVHEDGMHDTADSALLLLGAIGEPNVGVNPDTLDNERFDPSVAQPSPIAQLHMLAPHVVHWHIKTHTHPDAGHLDFRQFAVILWKAGYRGVALLESGGGADAIENHLRYARYMRAVLDDYIPNAVGLGSRGEA